MSRLIEKSETMVYTNCLRLLKDQEEARDMAQEVYLTVFLKLDTLKKPEAFFEWVKIIKINKCKNKLKKGNPYFLLEDANSPADYLDKDKGQGDPYAFIEDEHDQISPEKTLDTRETQKLLINLIDDLPDAQRMVLILFYYDDYSLKQIARIMEISEGTVKSRLAYGRLALKKALEKEKKKGAVLYGRAPVTLLAYIAHFLKKSSSDHQDKNTLLSIREAVLAALQKSGMIKAVGAGAAGASTAQAGTTGSVLLSAADSVAVESANAFISGGLSLKGLSLAGLWATAWGKAAITTIASAALIGSVAGGVSLTAKTKQLEPVPAQSQQQELRQEETEEPIEESVGETPRESVKETLEESLESFAESSVTENSTPQTTVPDTTNTESEETSEPDEEAIVVPGAMEESATVQEPVIVVEELSAAQEQQPVQEESLVTVQEESDIPEEQSVPQTEISEESSETVTPEATIENLEEELEAQQNNMVNTQANYDNAVEVYEDALAMVENDMAEAKIICERERNDWKESYENQINYNQQESELFTEEEIAYSLSNYQKWQELYDFVFSATVEDAKNQNFPPDFANVNTWGAELVEKEENLIFWQAQMEEQQARLDAAQAALDEAKGQ